MICLAILGIEEIVKCVLLGGEHYNGDVLFTSVKDRLLNPVTLIKAPPSYCVPCCWLDVLSGLAFVSWGGQANQGANILSRGRSRPPSWF